MKMTQTQCFSNFMEAENVKAKKQELVVNEHIIIVPDDNDDGDSNAHYHMRASSSSSSTVLMLKTADKFHKPSSNLPLSNKSSDMSKEIASELGSIKEAKTQKICNGYSSSSSACFPKPKDDLHMGGPPPFLKKLYQMVEDPETNYLVSWSRGRNSFIVWDYHQFSKTLLPRYFKHGNFWSFHRQLNTYGFKKTEADRYEFAHKCFLGGKKHLLNSIKRRGQVNKQESETMINGVDLTETGKCIAELDALKNDQKKLKEKNLKLRKQLEDSQNRLTLVEEHIKIAESKQKRKLSFRKKIAKNRAFIQKLIQKSALEEKEPNSGKFGKTWPQGTLASLPETIDASPSINCTDQLKKELMVVESSPTQIITQAVDPCSLKSPFEASMENGSSNSVPDQNEKETMMLGTSNADMPSAYHVMSEKLLGENSIIDEKFIVTTSEFYLDLEDLFGKSHDSGGNGDDLKRLVGCFWS